MCSYADTLLEGLSLVTVIFFDFAQHDLTGKDISTRYMNEDDVPELFNFVGPHFITYMILNSCLAIPVLCFVILDTLCQFSANNGATIKLRVAKFRYVYISALSPWFSKDPLDDLLWAF
jgi:hypothetical protein